MADSTVIIPFTKEKVDKSPATPGVYILYRGNELTYIGSSEVSIRSRLQRHLSGVEGTCTAKATHYSREACSNPKQNERAMLDAYKTKYGKLPRCNEVMP